MIVVLEPASPFAKRLRLRVTELEKFISPSMYEATPERMSKAFADGKHLGSMIQAYLMNQEHRYDIMEIYGPLVEEYKWVADVPELCEELVYWNSVIGVQNEVAITFEIGNYIIDFEGTIDCIVKDQTNWNYYLSDVKTASAWRTEDFLMTRLQSVYYTALFHMIRETSEGTTKFEYWVFVKNKKKGRMQRLVRDLDVAWCIKQLKGALTYYTETYEDHH